MSLDFLYNPVFYLGVIVMIGCFVLGNRKVDERQNSDSDNQKVGSVE